MSVCTSVSRAVWKLILLLSSLLLRPVQRTSKADWEIYVDIYQIDAKTTWRGTSLRCLKFSSVEDGGGHKIKEWTNNAPLKIELGARGIYFKTLLYVSMIECKIYWNFSRVSIKSLQKKVESEEKKYGLRKDVNMHGGSQRKKQNEEDLL